MKKKLEFLETIKGFKPGYDMSIIEKAYDIAEEMHRGQLRKSGEPYLVHPMAVAEILADLGMDEETIVSGLLHDVVEDTDYTKEQLIKDFSEDVALMVDGVTKLGSLKFASKEEQQAETYRKMFLAMSKDIRVLIIKLADRLHNLRTINYMTHEKIIEKCTETLDIYAPLAARLGIYSIKMELEDIALKFLYPEVYYDLAEQISERKEERDEIIAKVVAKLTEALEEINIPNDIYGRSKHFYSIYKKMTLQHKQLDEIFDLMAVRIIVEDVKDCYAVLGLVHTIWKPLPGRFKDYIAMPKPNMYQSLHTTVIGDMGSPFEIQIRTREMHRIAEYGIAAHWKYKEGIKKDQTEMKLAWLRQSLEWQRDVNDPSEYMESLKMDLFTSQVYVFTPNGDVMELPYGATPLDFAFKIHSDVGYKCVGAKVNGRMVTIDHQLENGTIVEIVTSSHSSGPSVDWLKIAKSSSARTKIRQWLKKENRNDSVDKGKEAIDRYIRKKGYDPQQLLKKSNINKLIKDLNFKDDEDLYTQVSYGGNLQSKVLNMLLSYNKEDEEGKKKSLYDDLKEISERKQKQADQKKKHHVDKTGVIVDGGVDNLMIQLGKCCNPVPGDDIIGFITKGRGITVHRKDCDNLKGLQPEDQERCINVGWDPSLLATGYDAPIRLITNDQSGILSKITKVCADMDISISGLNARPDNDGNFLIDLTVNVNDKSQVDDMCRKFKSLEGIFDAYRSN